jgi:hypothetical protein
MPAGVSALLTREITARNTSANGALGRDNRQHRWPRSIGADICGRVTLPSSRMAASQQADKDRITAIPETKVTLYRAASGVRHAVNTIEEMQKLLLGYRDNMRVEVETGIAVTAKTVADLRALPAGRTVWP